VSKSMIQVARLCERHGWSFQEPYTLALKLIVSRRRRGMNETQLLFWMAEATEDQRQEAINDALAIMEATK
jgi:hypothetical protein